MPIVASDLRNRRIYLRLHGPLQNIAAPASSRLCSRSPLRRHSGTSKCGHTLLFVDGKEMGQVPRLALCEDKKTQEVLLFHCDNEWNVLGSSSHPSTNEAKAHAERIYAGLSSLWADANVSEEEAEAYLDEILSRCSFCQRRFDHAEEMIADESEKAHICNHCIEEFHKDLCELRRLRQ